MFDIRLIREDSEKVKKNTKKRGYDPKLVDQILNLDDEWRKIKKQNDDLRSQRNKLSKQVNELKKAKKNADSVLKEVKSIPEKIKKKEEEMNKKGKEIEILLKQIPNIIHEKVPIGKDESENKVIKKWGKPQKRKLKPNSTFLEEAKLADFESSAKVAGNGFYYLKGDLGLLNQALLQFAIRHLTKKGYEYIEPPLMLRKEVMEGMVSFEEFENMIYKVEGENLFLIGTAEHAIGGLHSNEVVQELPKKYVGYSMCFRKEIGSHGIEEKGLYRTHQFNKVEQFVFCKPEDSWKYFEELQKNSEEIWEALEIPYRVLEMCTGDLGVMKARQFDIEAWFPSRNDYAEVTSLSNLTDNQARRLNIRYNTNQGTDYLHTLNNTAIATSRMMIALIENHMNEDGSINIPKALQPYIGKKKIN